MDPPDNPTPLKTEPEVEIASIPDDALIRMPHANWLNEFAMVLGMTRQNGPPMTPFRQGAIAKLRLAARYIRMLERECEIKRKGLSKGKDEADGNQHEPPTT